MPRVHCRCYPQFSVRCNEQAHHYSMHGAAKAVAEGGTLMPDALECDGTTRPISTEEKQQVMEAAEQWQQS